MHLPEQLITERLLLRWPTDADADEMFARYASDPEVTRYLRFVTHSSVDDTHAYLSGAAESRAAGTDFVWLVRERLSGKLLGAIGAHTTGSGAVELGYCYARDAWGRGVATEAARAVIAVVSEDESIRRIFATCAPENVASARVLEKVGLKFECTLRRHVVLANLDGEPHDADRFGFVRPVPKDRSQARRRRSSRGDGSAERNALS